MIKLTGRIHTKVDMNTKVRWEHFLLTHHHSIKGEYGPELGKAMELYMQQFNHVAINNEQYRKMNKTTRNVLKIISFALKGLPAYPILTPIVINAVIKDNIPRTDHRTFHRYLECVIPHLTDVVDDGVDKKSVKEFCEYVDRLFNDDSLK